MYAKFVLDHPKAVLPKYETVGAAGMDLASVEEVVIPAGEWKAIGTGLLVEICRGFEGQVRPRSGLAFKRGLTVLNSPGTIDSDYRGEIKVLLINHSPIEQKILVGDRIAQLVVAPVHQCLIGTSVSLSETERGHGGFGSTGTQTIKA